MILDFVIKFHLQDIANILSQSDVLGYYSIKIDFLKLFETYPDVGDKVLCSPVESLPKCHKSLIKVQQNILEKDEYKHVTANFEYCHLKKNVYCRFYGLPVCPELHRTMFPKNADLGCFLKVTGTVVRVTQAKMLEYQRKYVCVKCKHEICVIAEFENRYVLKAPTQCSNEETRCKCSTFTKVNMVSRDYCKDYQEIKIQELVNKLNIGTIPGSMWVVLENDLVDSCKPGDNVNICGTVRRRWRPLVSDNKSEVELVFEANYVEVCNTQESKIVVSAPDIKDCFKTYWSNFSACPLMGRDQILSSVCPQVYGLHVVKLALLLTVITGANHEVQSETNKKSTEDTFTTRVRGQSHLLLVGDPGTGKSQLLRAGAALTCRSVFASGAASTRAGLTCSALREEGEWQLEAGALVLADGGVCCVDELAVLSAHDRASIHEAMEQQTISVAKAGIVCKLNTRCAVIAACNPKGHYQTDQPLSVNVSLGTPLLSRFDLIFILLDSKSKPWDKLVSSYILFGGKNSIKNQWSLEKLQTYIALVGPKVTEMSPSANKILHRYYMMQRKSVNRDPSRTTVRMLDSLVRLSQAHCRLMYRSTILTTDAIVAASLVDLSMQDCTLNDTVDALHSTLSKYPDFEYLLNAKKLLSKLNLSDIWQDELLYYAKLLQVDHKTLENAIDKRDASIFAKFDDVSDDVQLPASLLITSSYFNKNNEDNKIVNENTSENNVVTIISNDKLAATLKKHAALNNDTMKPEPKQKSSNKRKLNSSKSKKSKVVKINNKTLLDAVPSVNDIFNDIGMSIENDNQDDNSDEKDESTFKSNKENHKMDIFEEIENKVDCDNEETKQSSDKNTSVLDKLQKFQFHGKHDLNQFREKVTSDSVESQKNKSSIIEHKSSNSSSQISIFENSDFDIDLDI